MGGMLNPATTPFNLPGFGHFNRSNLMLFDAVVDVNGFGDYTDIQTALDEGKTRIFVRAGTYEIGASISIISSNVIIIGEHRNNVILSLADNADCDVIQVGDGTVVLNGITLENIQIDGNKANQTAGSCIRVMDDITNLAIRDCDIHDGHERGLEFKSVAGACATNTNIINNLIHANGQGAYPEGAGIMLDDCTSTYIQGNRIYDNGNDAGINVNSGNVDTFVMNNIITGGGRRGISVSSGSTVISANIIKDNDFAAIFMNSPNNVISNNYIEDNNQNSSETIKAEVRIASPGNNVITGNTIHITGAGPDYGMEIDSSYNTITGNQFEDDTGVTGGLYLYDSASYNVVIANIFEGSWTTNIVEHASSSNNDISHNILA